MNGRDLTLGLIGALALGAILRRPGGSADIPASLLGGVVYAGGDYAHLRNLAYALKEPGSARVGEAADAIVASLPQTVRGPGIVLVPIPSSKGDTTLNLHLAEALAARIGATVVDALHGPERQSSRDRKKAGLPGLRAQQMPMTLRAQRQVDLAGSVYLIDNVLDTGETLRAAQRALGRPVGAMVLAVTSRPEGSAARDPYAPIRKLGYTDSEITRALTAAGQGPRALERGDDTTQTAGPTRQGAYPGLNFRPPPAVRAEALRGLQLRKANEQRGKRVDPKTGAGPGGWWIGVGRAIQLATLPAMPPREITRMRDYFRRHAVDMKSAGAARGQVTPGVVAWLLWGGDEGRDFARDLAGQMDRMDAEREGARRGTRAK